MKQILCCGSTTDGKRHFVEFDSEDGATGNGRSYTLPIRFNDENRYDNARREYYPLLEKL